MGSLIVFKNRNTHCPNWLSNILNTVVAVFGRYLICKKKKKMDMNEKRRISLICFVFISCICSPKATAMKEAYEFGKKLQMTPLTVWAKFGRQKCFLECETYGACLSINYNRKQLVCELNDGWKNITIFLINDDDYVYRKIPHLVITDYFVFCFDQLQIHSYNKYWCKCI